MSETEGEMRADYGKLLGKGVRGKYYERFKAGTNVVLLDEDVAVVFSDSKSVNEALRGLIKLSKQAGRTPARPKREIHRKAPVKK